MKTCTKCQAIKPYEDFNKAAKSPDGYNWICRDCKRKIDNEYYKNSERRKAAVRVNNSRRQQESHQFVYQYLLDHPCVDCGETDPVVLEFDHVRGEKLMNVAKLRDGYSIPAITSEIDKCEVRCANCHKRVTAQRGNWYASLLGGNGNTLLS